MYHKYLESVGFNIPEHRKLLDSLIIENQEDENFSSSWIDEDETCHMIEFDRSCGDKIGITVISSLYEDEKEVKFDCVYPYLKSGNRTLKKVTAIEQMSSDIGYLGICDDERVEISIIFRVANASKYARVRHYNKYDIDIKKYKASVSLSGLAESGIILLPVAEDSKDEKNDELRKDLIQRAQEGDTEAIETLTLDDIDTINMIKMRIGNEDILSIVSSYFMPYGLECDVYSVMGEIMEISETVNKFTDIPLYIMKVKCNDIEIDICIRKDCLLGEPKVGRRFKGVIWLQGIVEFEDDRLKMNSEE